MPQGQRTRLRSSPSTSIRAMPRLIPQPPGPCAAGLPVDSILGMDDPHQEGELMSREALVALVAVVSACLIWLV